MVTVDNLIPEETLQEIRRNWRTFYPADRRKGIICPLCGSGSGKHGSGITENPKKPGQLTCWNGACNFQGDILDLLEQDKGLTFTEAVQYAADSLGIWVDREPSTVASKNDHRTGSDETADKDIGQQDERPTNARQTPQIAHTDYRSYYEECRNRIDDPAAASYLQARGISLNTAKSYRLGYDPAWISPSVVAEQEAKGSSWKPAPTARIIIPATRSHYIARAIDPDAPYQKMNECGNGKIGFFNGNAVHNDGQPVFITEGAFDALSIIEVGAAAIALNSTANADNLLKHLETYPTDAPLIICLDKDAAGQGTAKRLADGLQSLHIKHITADICGGYKDPNEALQKDREAFKSAVEAAEQEANKPEPLPGLLTYNDAVAIFKTADDRYIELRTFPAFSKTAKIRLHDSIVVAADTGVGKSSLAINFLNDLNNDYPCIYFNLEMDTITVLRRLTAIYSGIEIDRIEGYQHDKQTAEEVNASLKALTSRKPLQVIQGAYILQDIEEIIKQSTKDRTEPTIVIIDHSLLVDTKERTGSRYDRFTQVSEGLRKLALSNNIILFVLLQQNRAGKTDDNERPKNSSLKESGSWENDATQICFLWYDQTDKRKKLLLTKNRSGGCGEFVLNYWKETQTYTEAADNIVQTGDNTTTRKIKPL